MCGIVGYCGFREPRDVIVSGLRKLEYRGYDSAGVAIYSDGVFKRIRAEGKLAALDFKLQTETFTGHIGIGHTRWATHGVPSERNAHPHQAGGISLVHNGIIENYLEIRESLIGAGKKIQSDTDSELVAHLLADEVSKTQDLFLAVQNVLPRLKGAYSIVAVWDKKPDTLVAFKDGPPLVVGLPEATHLEAFIASDVQALVQYTKKVIYLNDQEIVVAQKNSIHFYTAKGVPITKSPVTIHWSADQVEKQGYKHFMLKEIHEQPRAFAAAIQPYVDLEKFSVKVPEIEFLTDIQKITIIACGTSYYAGLAGKYYFETVAGISTEVDIASEFRYRNPIVNKNDLIITISQSGETADTLAAIRLAKSFGAKTLSICNVKNSSIDREADLKLYMNSGPEIGVASTKAFVSTLGVLNICALALARLKDPSLNHQDYVRALLAVPSQIETVLNFDKYFAEAAETLKKFRGFLYLGRGVNFPIALEGALKLKELAYMHAEGYAAGEMKHGPLALVDQDMAVIMIAPTDDLYDKTVSNLEEVKARGGQIISIGTGENNRLRKLSQSYLALPQSHWATNPILAIIPLQLLAYHLADFLGRDVDQPRNLAKSVTVE